MHSKNPSLMWCLESKDSSTVRKESDQFEDADNTPASSVRNKEEAKKKEEIAPEPQPVLSKPFLIHNMRFYLN